MKRFIHGLFLLVLFAFTALSVKAQTENKSPFGSITFRKVSKTEVADISFTIAEGSKINKVKVILPDNKESGEIVVTPEENVYFLKVKLTKDINEINLQAWNNNQFVDNRSVTITHTPTDKPGESKPVDETGVIGGKQPVINAAATNTDDKKPRVRVMPTGDISRVKQYTLTITPENLPAEATEIRLFRNGKNGVREESPFKIFEKKKDAKDDAENKYEFDAPILWTVDLKEGENKFFVGVFKPAQTTSALTAGSGVTDIAGLTAETTIECDPCGQSNSNSLNTRAIVGFEQAGASSADSESRPFLNLFVNFPIALKSKVIIVEKKRTIDGKEVIEKEKVKVKDDEPPFAVWTDFRFTSTTVQSFAKLANVSTTLINPLFGGTDAKVNNIVQSFQLNTGIDYRILPEGALQGFFLPGKNSVSFIAGGGITNPLKSDQTAQIFKIPTVPPTIGTTPIPNPAFTALFPGVNFTGKENIAFVSPERDRFFRRWFAGFRLKTRFFENEEKTSLINQSPAMLDITFGQDEAITRKLTGKVLTIEGFTPFPIRKFDYVYLFGGASTLLTRNVNETIPPFFFEPPTSGGGLTNNNTVIVPIDSSVFTRSNRDTFRFGIGIDLIRLLLRTDAAPKN